jgi:hypothetical protein
VKRGVVPTLLAGAPTVLTTLALRLWAERVIRENDIRYIVLLKRYPGMNWRFWKERAGLYRKAYESVVGFAPHQTRRAHREDPGSSVCRRRPSERG